MAFVIQEMEKFRFNYETASQNNHGFNQSIHLSIINNFHFMRDSFVRDTAKLENYHVDFDIRRTRIVARYIAHKIYKNITLLFTVVLDYKTQEVRIRSKLVNMVNGYVKIEGKQRRKLITKYLCSRAYSSLGESKIAINVETGELKLQSPIYYLHSVFKSHSLQTLVQFLTKIYAQNVKDFYEHILVIACLTGQQFSVSSHTLKNRLSDQKSKQVYRFSKFLNVFLNLASETSNQQQDLNLNLQKEAESYRRLKENRVQIGQGFSSLAIFADFDFEGERSLRKAGEQPLDFLERKHLQGRLELPLSQKSSIPNENYFVLNYIKVSKKLSESKFRKIKTGGFTTIYLSEIEYWYVGSYCVGLLDDFQMQEQPLLRKSIIVKREDNKRAEASGKSRVRHETFILKRIKHGISMFLPKYYLLAEKDKSYENDLLMDFINYPNLSEYIEQSRATLSLNTKIYFVLMIGQALRYLKEYKIAHLDLKPSNIMTHRRLTLKLIDFGESYHPELLKNHEPGFSMPYSAPENYGYPDSYSYKNDVFSLGVIMYELFLGRHPFFLHDERLRDRVYSEGSYLRYWHETPEELLMHGEPVICPVIHSVMARCLHPDPDHRPELEWIVLIFRECLDYFS